MREYINNHWFLTFIIAMGSVFSILIISEYICTLINNFIASKYNRTIKGLEKEVQSER